MTAELAGTALEDSSLEFITGLTPAFPAQPLPEKAEGLHEHLWSTLSMRGWQPRRANLLQSKPIVISML
jgi:hypothetical protein